MLIYFWRLCVVVFFLAVLVLSACMPAGSSTAAPATSESTNPLPAPTQETTMNAHWVFQTAGAIWGSPALSQGSVFIGSDDGNLYALDAQTGSLRWKFASQGIVRSQPAIANGLVYFTSDDGLLYAIHVKDGKQAWSADIGNSLDHAKRENLGGSPARPITTMFSPLRSCQTGPCMPAAWTGISTHSTADTGKVIWTFTSAGKIRATLGG